MNRFAPTTALTAAALTVVAAGVATPASSAPVPARATYLQTMTGDETGEAYGWAVSELADLDGDHIQDVIIGAPSHRGADGSLVGHVDVRSGRTGRILYRFLGLSNDRLGYAIADAGDVDRDGVHDIIAGAPGGGTACGPRSASPGRAYVYSGATGRLLLTLRGTAPGGHFGSAVSGAGDIDRDGHADLLIGAQCASRSGPSSGAAYLYSGRTGRQLYQLPADRAGDEFGTAAAPISDVDGDQVPDLLVGAKDAGTLHHGRVYLISGRTGRRLLTLAGSPGTRDVGWFFAAGVPDLDGDHRSDIYVGDFDAGRRGGARGLAYVFSSRTGQLIRHFAGARSGSGLGPGRYAGDVDGDGTGDLVIGSYTDSAGGRAAGKVQVFSGATGKPLRTVVSHRPGEDLGFDAVGVGDVNGDHHPDLLVSAAGHDRVYVIGT